LFGWGDKTCACFGFFHLGLCDGHFVESWGVC
jgi:hypothetical protein